MDTMSIKSIFLTGIISKIVRKIVRENLGVADVDVILNKIDIESNDQDSYRIHVDTDLVLSKDDIKKLVKDLI